MMNTAKANILRKVLALKPDGLQGVLNDLSTPRDQIYDLGKRLNRRLNYIRDLSRALSSAPASMQKAPIQKMIDPLKDMVGKIQQWVNGAKASIDNLNREVKSQNVQLSNAILEFVRQNKDNATNNSTNAVNAKTVGNANSQNLNAVNFAAIAA